MPDAREKLEEFKKRIKTPYEIFEISALSGEGLKKLMYMAYDMLQNAPEPAGVDETEMKIVKVEAKPEFEVVAEEEGVWRVIGERVEKLVVMTDWEREASLKRMVHILNKMGVEDALRKAGAKDGDLICIADREFDFAD